MGAFCFPSLRSDVLPVQHIDCDSRGWTGSWNGVSRGGTAGSLLQFLLIITVQSYLVYCCNKGLSKIRSGLSNNVGCSRLGLGNPQAPREVWFQQAPTAAPSWVCSTHLVSIAGGWQGNPEEPSSSLTNKKSTTVHSLVQTEILQLEPGDLKLKNGSKICFMMLDERHLHTEPLCSGAEDHIADGKAIAKAGPRSILRSPLVCTSPF